MKRNCTNCAFCERFKYFRRKTEMMSCWQMPDVRDHAFVQPMNVAEDYVCAEHRTKEERGKELFEDAKKGEKNFLKMRKRSMRIARNALKH